MEEGRGEAVEEKSTEIDENFHFDGCFREIATPSALERLRGRIRPLPPPPLSVAYLRQCFTFNGCLFITAFYSFSEYM